MNTQISKNDVIYDTSHPSTHRNVVQWIYDIISRWFHYLFPKTVLRIASIYVVWIILHYVASHLYIYWCTPISITGILMSPFLVPAPHCEALRWMIYHGAIKIQGMWILLGGYVLHYIERMFTV